MRYYIDFCPLFFMFRKKEGRERKKQLTENVEFQGAEGDEAKNSDRFKTRKQELAQKMRYVKSESRNC